MAEEEIDRVTEVLYKSVGTSTSPLHPSPDTEEGLTVVMFMKAACGFDEDLLRESLRERIEISVDDGWIYVAGIKEGDIDGVFRFVPPGYAKSESYVSLSYLAIKCSLPPDGHGRRDCPNPVLNVLKRSKNGTKRR